MRFGYGLITCQRHPDDPRGDAALYAEALSLASEAEALGFDSVWTSEHHFADDAYAPSLLPLSAAIAARTERIQIGTGLLLAPLHDPIRLAEDAATVDLLSAGRFVLGLGLGWLGWELGAFGVALADRVPRLERAIEVCRRAWGSGLVEPEGVAVAPKPAAPGGPPIWLGGHVEPAIRRAARLADGWMAGEPSSHEFAEQAGWFAEELRAAGRPSPDAEVAGYWPVFVWDGPEDAWDLVRPFHHYTEWKYEDQEAAKGRLGRLPRPPELDADSEAALRAPMVCGGPEEVAGQIRALARIAGPRFTFVARLYYPGMERRMMRRSTRLFAEEVMPRLRA